MPVLTLAPAGPALPTRRLPPRGESTRAIRRAAAAVILAMLLPAVGRGAVQPQRTAAQEYDLKAAFLFNFAQFVEWPAEAFAQGDTPIVIGILGDDPFGNSLDEIVEGETIRNHPLVVRRYHSIEQVDTCHILFISSSNEGHLEHVLKTLGRRSILTVGETKDFTSHSGMIGFEVSQRHLRLRINLGAAQDARLTISSKLLRQAEIVGTAGNRN
jgi:hypothetical protein